MSEVGDRGLGELFGDALGQLASTDSFDRLRVELSGLGRELAAAALSAGIGPARSSDAEQAAAQDDGNAQHSKDTKNTKQAKDREASTEPLQQSAKPSRKSRKTAASPRRTLRPRRGEGERRAGAFPDDSSSQCAQAPDTAVGDDFAADGGGDRQDESLTANLIAVGEKLGSTADLVDAVATMLEEQTERLATVEELLDRVVAYFDRSENDHVESPSIKSQCAEQNFDEQIYGDQNFVGNDSKEQADYKDNKDESDDCRVLIFDPDGVRASFLAGNLGVAGFEVRIAVGGDDAEEVMSVYGPRWKLLVHAEADPDAALAVSRSTNAGESNVIGDAMVYYTEDDANSRTQTQAEDLAQRLGSASVVSCQPDAEALVRTIHENSSRE